MPSSMAPTRRDATPDQVRRLLLALGAAMVAGGMPVFDAEDEVKRVGWALGHPDVQVSASPTSLWVALSTGEPAAMQAAGSFLRLDQSKVVNDIRRGLLAGRLDVAGATEALGRVRSLRPHFGPWAAYVGNAIVAAGITMIMQPGIPNILLVATLSLLVTGLARFSGRHALLATLLPTTAAFAVSVVVLQAAALGLVEGPLRTIICPLAVLLPGATLVTGMAELAGGMMISGASRLTYGFVLLLLFTLGVVGAALVLGTPAQSLGNIRVSDLGLWAAPLGLAIIAFGMILSESLPLSLFPYAFTILAVTFATQTAGQAWAHIPAVGTFFGAMVASFGASAIEAIRPDISRLVIFLPSFWLLVPGTLGVIGITQIGTNQAGSSDVIGVVAIIITIALGLLIGTAMARPLLRIARRRRRNSSLDTGVPVTLDDER